MSRHRACSPTDVAEGALLATKLGGRRVLVFHLSDGWYATQGHCSHIFAPLARGTLNADCGHLTCPFHHAIFDVRTGLVEAGPSFPPGIHLTAGLRPTHALETFPVEVDGDGVWVTLP